MLSESEQCYPFIRPELIETYLQDEMGLEVELARTGQFKRLHFLESLVRSVLFTHNPETKIGDNQEYFEVAMVHNLT